MYCFGRTSLHFIKTVFIGILQYMRSTPKHMTDVELGVSINYSDNYVTHNW